MLCLFLLLLNVNGFIFESTYRRMQIKPKQLTQLKPLNEESNMNPNKPTINPYQYPDMDIIHIYPMSSIIYYEITNEKRLEMQEEINNKTDNRFIINMNYIYVSQYDYNNNQSRCQIFVYVYDKETKLTGEYILESMDYDVPRTESLICSFYEMNKRFYTSFSYYQYAMDTSNYNEELNINFIYYDDKFYRNYNPFNKISYTPIYAYNSELKYKGIHWKKSDKITYYKNYINYYLID